MRESAPAVEREGAKVILPRVRAVVDANLAAWHFARIIAERTGAYSDDVAEAPPVAWPVLEGADDETAGVRCV